jgi:ABC-2 type transport system permease protein
VTRVTFAMMVGIPLIQLVLFGFAINSDPKHLPAAVLLADHGPQGPHVATCDSKQRVF